MKFSAELKDKEIYTIQANQLAPCSRPIIIDPSENEKVTPIKNTEGFSLDLKCEADGSPEPTYRWFYLGRNRDQEILVTSEARYFVPKMKLEDSESLGDYGYYKCVASNVRGSSNVTVFVEEASFLDSPVQENPFEQNIDFEVVESEKSDSYDDSGPGHESFEMSHELFFFILTS